ncbi:cupin domain-containing protein [Glaciimonas immobilis]|uniref:Putative RmlC-like cupin family protein n=1 Tax=Glaciimonas immobilis TaxID=728004 RepID=A0A840RR07_9BURK|nr:cupin domain-containing protein [Glaciimonas immobilis]KAF3998141.1 cupin domain-containing protein [Glaciimonas immobilis]MBB5199154.1 putative RmlC-like cupin family protein [Glaciimonas immobilis]
MQDGLTDAEAILVTVHPNREIATSQRLPYFVGISAITAGAKALSMYLVVVPPGGHAAPHVHCGYETGIYVLEGSVETRYGPGLCQSVITEAGDFLFIPPGVPHQPFNLSATIPARAIVARNQPDEHEQVLPYDSSNEV